MSSVFDSCFTLRLATHVSNFTALQLLKPTPKIRYFQNADYKFICGTNLIDQRESGRVHSQWALYPTNLKGWGGEGIQTAKKNWWIDEYSSFDGTVKHKGACFGVIRGGKSDYNAQPPVIRNYDLSTGRNVKLAEITDGLSNTLLLSESLQGFDDDCRGLTFRGAGAFFTAYCGPNSKNADITETRVGKCVDVPYANLPCSMGASTVEPFRFAARSRHRSGVNAALADGSVRFFSDSVGIETWRNLSSTHDGQSVSLE